ncbi:helix-turn-helix domain-containing protein [Paenactinomyces guangxiensis]|uniref:Helix-turn-helix transcriptional regulator n=1 Tax=Paenactinomyces guangxiensis TaxID=1490290 RepID=A0A7W1WPY7_9BACL|nr:helix-turn-helix transcriptional regulator [Paenactinomyces guangxiensis]MBA4493926.1 helix-turn-helix transcriptional regulator [Paenactinomyces guangxiensis]MBH8591393.1 helix-turn-helix transcriptional regulator [Paenactinomyces guangxiensis]
MRIKSRNKGWKQKHLLLVDESLQVISNMERGYTYPTPIQLGKLAKALGTTTDFILGVMGNPSPSLPQRPKTIDLKKALDEDTTHWGDQLISQGQKALIKNLIAVVEND